MPESVRQTELAANDNDTGHLTVGGFVISELQEAGGGASSDEVGGISGLEPGVAFGGVEVGSVDSGDQSRGLAGFEASADSDDGQDSFCHLVLLLSAHVGFSPRQRPMEGPRGCRDRRVRAMPAPRRSSPL